MFTTLTLIAAAAIAATPQPFLSQEYVDSLNAKGMPWRAELPRGIRLAHATIDDVKALMGVKSKGARLPRRQYSAEEAKAVPATFEAKDKWPQCPTITTIRDQSACGSCWAIAAAEAISDRYCTYGVDKNLPISAANLMECCWYCGNGCNGGDPSAAWQYWVSKGLLSSACQPYPFPKCEHHISGGQYPPCPAAEYPTPSCSKQCNTSEVQPKYYKGERSYGVLGESDYMTEVYNNGPIEVAFSVYKDFLTYSGGVYVQQSQDYLGGHAVRLVGWGTLNGVPYWKIANSWNSDWGLDGYFLIKRGVDECGIETSGVAGIPAKM